MQKRKTRLELQWRHGEPGALKSGSKKRSHEGCVTITKESGTPANSQEHLMSHNVGRARRRKIKLSTQDTQADIGFSKVRGSFLGGCGSEYHITGTGVTSTRLQHNTIPGLGLRM